MSWPTTATTIPEPNQRNLKWLSAKLCKWYTEQLSFTHRFGLGSFCAHARTRVSIGLRCGSLLDYFNLYKCSRLGAIGTFLCSTRRDWAFSPKPKCLRIGRNRLFPYGCCCCFLVDVVVIISDFPRLPEPERLTEIRNSKPIDERTDHWRCHWIRQIEIENGDREKKHTHTPNYKQNQQKWISFVESKDVIRNLIRLFKPMRI